MVFVETPMFTKQISTLLPDDSYAELQETIRTNPEIGDIISGCGGLRKVRWRAEDRGKSGGIRVIYYWYKSGDLTYMMLAYPKNQQENLTADQTKTLKRLVEMEFNNG